MCRDKKVDCSSIKCDKTGWRHMETVIHVPPPTSTWHLENELRTVAFFGVPYVPCQGCNIMSVV